MPPLYPNFYIFLVAPPSGGKGIALNRAEELLRSVEEFHIAPSSVSKASLMDALGESARRIARLDQIPPHVEFHALTILAREFGMFLPVFDPEIIAALTDLWDGAMYKEYKRGNKLRLTIENPCVNMIAGCTPAYLTSSFPEMAWEHGLTSRIVMIYSGETIISKDLFAEDGNVGLDHKVDALKHDLGIIKELYGQVKWEPEARQVYQSWYESGQEFKEVPRPSHPRLIGYVGRRWTHLTKLCIIASVSRSCDLRITLDDFRTAIGWLMEAECYMEDIFKAMPTGGDGRALEELYHFIFNLYIKNNRKPVHEQVMTRFLAERVPAQSVTKIIELLVRSGRVEITQHSGGYGLYRPVVKGP